MTSQIDSTVKQTNEPTFSYGGTLKVVIAVGVTLAVAAVAYHFFCNTILPAATLFAASLASFFFLRSYKQKVIENLEASESKSNTAFKLLIEHLKVNPQALQVEGIFRESASFKNKQELLAKITKDPNAKFLPSLSFEGAVDPDAVHLTAGVLKEIFKKMNLFGSTPALNDKFYQVIEKTFEGPETLQDLIDALPEENKKELGAYLGLLCDVEKQKELNRMTHINLSIVFAPNLNTNPLLAKEAMEFATKINNLGLLLLQNYETLKF